MSEDLSMIEGFVEEAREHLETIEDDILSLERQGDSPDTDTVDRVFRAMHTVKGNAGFFELINIRDLSHALEDLLSCIRNGEFSMSRNTADAVLEGVDQLNQMLDNPLQSNDFVIESILGRIRGLIAQNLGSEKQEELSQKLEISSDDQNTKFEISGFDLQKKDENSPLTMINFDLKKWEDRTHQSPIEMIHRLIENGQIFNSIHQFIPQDINRPLKDITFAFSVLYSSKLNTIDLANILDLDESAIKPVDVVEKRMQNEKNKEKLTTPNSLQNLANELTQKDLAPLVKLMESLKERQFTEGVIEAEKILAERLHKLAENILMGDTAFESGLNKLKQGLKKLKSDPMDIPADAEIEAIEKPKGSSEAFFRDFIATTLQSLDELEVFALETEKGSNEALDALSGYLHTLKGEMGILNQASHAELIHNIEERITKGDFSMDMILTYKDYLVNELRSWDGGSFKIAPSISVLLGEEEANIETTISQAPQESQEPIKPETLAESLEQPTEPKIIEKIEEKIPSLDPPKSEGEIAQENKGSNSNAGATTIRSEDTLRVGVQRLDKLIDTIGEAVIAHSIAAADPVVTELKKDVTSSDRALLQQKLSRLDVIMRQIQEFSMSMRMISLRGTFQKMARLVRDLSRKISKPIEFHMEGEDTELDKSIVENLGDPLIHMVRNSVDHGIESPEERRLAGKPETGNVTLRSYHKSGNVVIEIEDDGKGLDVDKIRAKAIERGVISADQPLENEEIFQLIFAPGFSTAEQVTQISGRGVGMDVVKRNIEALRGAVDIFSTPGQGTVFTVRLPLTLAIISGMVVRCDSEKYIIPTLSVIETLRVSHRDVQSVTEKGDLIKIRDEMVKVYNLNTLLEIEDNRNSWEEKIGLVVEDAMGRKCAMLVDAILDQQQVVIKKIGEGIGELPGLSGGAIMSDGSVSLILDVNGILKIAYQ